MEKLNEKCAVFGVYGKGFDAARMVYYGLYALQHRGQETSGIASSNGKEIFIHKGEGLVPQVYSEKDFKKLKGYMAIGHNRYSTSGGAAGHIQPVFDEHDILALAHNGNLPDTGAMRRFLVKLGMHTKGKNDSELMHMLIKYYLVKKYSLEDAITASFPLFTGAFCLIMMTKDKIAAVRDPHGIRPLSLGKLNGGFVIASETCAFDIVNAKFIREVNPGEMILIDKTGLHSYQLAPSNLKLDIFEFIYFCRPDSTLMGKSVYQVRENFGRALAKEFTVDADVVMPVPESSIPAAVGFSKQSKLPFSFGLVKNRYIGRTFIMPDQHLRDRSVQMKLNPIKEEIKGKRIILIDDSIIRGTTSKKIVKMLRDAGAKTVHLLSSCPPYKFPDFYGIDTPSQKQLIAAHATVPQIKKFIGADSLHYLSYDAMIKATGLPENVFCTSCFTGIYPIDIGKNAKRIKNVKIVVHKEKNQKTKLPAPSYEKTRSAYL